MESVSRRRGGGIFESLYKVVMRRNSVYVTFVIAGAFLGERAVDYGVHKLWEANNVGGTKEKGTEWDVPLCFVRAANATEVFCYHLKSDGMSNYGQFCTVNPIYASCQKRYEDIPVLGQRPSE
ncbi:Cytochrome b-c1 complex subunit 9 [Glycine max]|nr:Cytochrome b-c1 complex subunit 9 [Glycine max]